MPPVNSKTFIERLMILALNELEFWKYRNENSIDADLFKRLKAYWIEGAHVTYPKEHLYRDYAWSAAFISYLMRKAGADTHFKYSASHHTYIRWAVKNRKLNNSEKFKGYKPSEISLEIGDLICFPRQAGITYDTDHAYAAHADLVIGFEGSKVITIGGNVSDTVSITKVSIDANRKLTNTKYHCVIKNGMS